MYIMSLCLSVSRSLFHYWERGELFMVIKIILSIVRLSHWELNIPSLFSVCLSLSLSIYIYKYIHCTLQWTYIYISLLFFSLPFFTWQGLDLAERLITQFPPHPNKNINQIFFIYLLIPYIVSQLFVLIHFT